MNPSFRITLARPRSSSRVGCSATMGGQLQILCLVPTDSDYLEKLDQLPADAHVVATGQNAEELPGTQSLHWFKIACKLLPS